MHIAQIVKVELRGSAANTLSYAAHTRVQEWLTQWTPARNFKAVIAGTRDEAIERCRQVLRKQLIPSWIEHLGVKHEHFVFRISDQDAPNGEFWMSSGVVCGTDFYIGAPDGKV